jgi:exosome complex component RRP41
MEVNFYEPYTKSGVLQTAINAVTLALVDAGIPMNDYICATSAGLVGDTAILGPISTDWANRRSE